MFLNIWPIINGFIHLFPLYTFGFFNSLNIILAVNFFFYLSGARISLKECYCKVLMKNFER